MIKQKWEYNGKDYPSFAEAKAAEKKDSDKAEIFVRDFFAGKYHYSFPEGCEAHTEGYWLITDEGPIDFGSSGRPMPLAYVHGTLLEAAHYAAKLPRFWGYGPGHIEKIEVVQL
jgi:hypothetical protein